MDSAGKDVAIQDACDQDVTMLLEERQIQDSLSVVHSSEESQDSATNTQSVAGPYECRFDQNIKTCDRGMPFTSIERKLLRDARFNSDRAEFLHQGILLLRQKMRDRKAVTNPSIFPISISGAGLVTLKTFSERRRPMTCFRCNLNRELRYYSL